VREPRSGLDGLVRREAAGGDEVVDHEVRLVGRGGGEGEAEKEVVAS
jgi:hypothetical protein